MTMEKKEEALDAAVSQIERQFGKGAIMKMGDAAQVEQAVAIVKNARQALYRLLADQ